MLLVVLLGGGTLRQERALGTAGFTLALPVTRARLFATRAAVGAAQVLALAALPAILVTLGDRTAPFGLTCTLALGWLACGLALLAASLCLATWVTQELVAWLLTYALFFAWEGLVNVTALRRLPGLDLYRLLSAARLADGSLAQRVLTVLALALALFALAAWGQGRALRERAPRTASATRVGRRLRFPLLYKSWRESRGRWRIATLVLGGLALLLIFDHVHLRSLMGATSYAGFLYARFYATVGRALFAMLVVLLALGGLHREGVLGTAVFSLALPVSRQAHVWGRAAVGLAQVALLAGLPALLIPVASLLVGQRFPWPAAVALATLWAVGGSIVFGVTFVISALVRSEVVAFATALIVLRLGPVALAQIPQAAGLTEVLAPRGTLTPEGLTITVPWLRLLVTAGVAASLLWIATWITRRGRLV